MGYQIYRTTKNELLICDSTGEFRNCQEASFDAIFQAGEAADYLATVFQKGTVVAAPALDKLHPPVGDQEIWAAGVTYFRSRTARMEEAESGGGDVFYDKVYEAPRPELFFKSTASRARGHGDAVCIRSDSTWDVPEPELTLAISSSGKVFGYSIGNDMSSRSIEGENPLYLPQAKVYKGACSIGPCLVVRELPTKETSIHLKITRNGDTVFQGETNAGQIKRGFDELAEYLFHSNEFPKGAYLMTGTGIVPDSDFTLANGDGVEISIDGAGTLRNFVETA
ncbi:MAG: fumarylacetoacetate hydrolase family protein [Verrucomicrobiales bacterium]|nr:fumarylacetoacetate hydrolase family protein [Verrucomicrobiales bacterium]